MVSPRLARSAVLLTACAATLAVAAPAGARTYAVSGRQIVVDENAGKFKMRGGLIGPFRTTSFNQLATSPIYHAQGTEKFRGCLDRKRDHSCKGDPSGTISFDFDYWAKAASPDPASLFWGACWHPMTSGTGDFAGVEGVLMMVDTPTGKSVQTRYIGNLTLGHHAAHHAAARRSARSRAATAGGPPASSCGPTA